MKNSKVHVPGSRVLVPRGDLVRAGSAAIDQATHAHRPIRGAKPAKILVTSLVDDSGSIESAGNAGAIRRGHNAQIAAYRERAERVDNLLVRTRYLNGRTLFGPTHPRQAVLMDGRNYQPQAGTPLFRESAKTLEEVEAAAAVLANDFSVFTMTYIMTDGANTGDGDAAQVRQIIERMLATGKHIVAGIGVDDDSTDFVEVFRSMGIPEQWIDVWSREDGDIIEGMTHVAATASFVEDEATFGHTSMAGFTRVSRGPEAATKTAGTQDLAEMLAPAQAPLVAAPVPAGAVAISAAPGWSPVDHSTEAALKFMPELGEYVLQFPQGVNQIIVGREEPNRGLRDPGVFFVEVTDPAGLVSRRHIKIERIGGWERVWLGLQGKPKDYRITILDKLDPEKASFVVVNGKFITGNSQVVSDGSEISLSPTVKFRLGLPGNI